MQAKIDMLKKDNTNTEFIEHNSEFHNYIFDIIGNKELKKSFLETNTQLYQTRIQSIRIPNQLDPIIQEHYIIIQGIKIRNDDKAKHC